MSNTCHDCGVQEGERHKAGCDMERCPFCGYQLISCDCVWELLGLEGGTDLTDAQTDAWEELLEKKGYVPYIRWPVLCARCGGDSGGFFRVSNEEWEKYIQIDMRDKVLCRPCYDIIKDLID